MIINQIHINKINFSYFFYSETAWNFRTTYLQKIHKNFNKKDLNEVINKMIINPVDYIIAKILNLSG